MKYIFENENIFSFNLDITKKYLYRNKKRNFQFYSSLRRLNVD